MQVNGSLASSSRIQMEAGNMTTLNVDKVGEGVCECIASNIVASVITSTLLIIGGELQTVHSEFNNMPAGTI